MEAKHEQYLKELTAAVEKQLMVYVRTISDANRRLGVAEAMRYSLEAGGKRIRPVLTLEFCRLCGGTQKQAMAAACAVEMIHTFSLIHDDLPEMDNDDFRRGKPSCHKTFGQAVALLAGDALSIAAFDVLMTDQNQLPEVKVNMAHILAEASGAVGMIDGQMMDMAFETRKDVTLEELESMCAAKTGALIRAACKLGCAAAGASAEQTALADRFGEKLGLAFQVVDDILDVTSTSETLGKPVGSDAEAGKTTFVTLLGIESAQKKAELLTHESIQVLQSFQDAAFLLELTESLLVRKK